MGVFCSCFHVADDQDDNRSNNSEWFFRKFVNKHRRGQTRAISSSNQQSAPSNSRVALNNSSDANGARNIASSSGSTSRSRVQLEPIGLSDIRVNEKSTQLKSGEENEVANNFPWSDDEDSCPTCFEEYTEENPKIVMKCSHHYHLGCIYEWMERSENCPACRKLMLFDE